MSLENRRVEGTVALYLVCEVSSNKENFFSDSSCSPELYLVQGHTVCSNLPDVVSAKKLVEISQEGSDEVSVEATWEELPGKCVLVLRKSSCEEDEASGSGSGDTIIDVGESESRLVKDLAEAEGYLSGRSIVLRAAQGRTYSSISLSGFTLLSSGSTSIPPLSSIEARLTYISGAFTVSKPVVTYVSSGGFPSGVVSYPYNKWATLPYLQLTGVNYQDTLALGALILFTLLALQLRTVSFTPIKRSEQ